MVLPLLPRHRRDVATMTGGMTGGTVAGDTTVGVAVAIAAIDHGHQTATATDGEAALGPPSVTVEEAITVTTTATVTEIGTERGIATGAVVTAGAAAAPSAVRARHRMILRTTQLARLGK